MGFQKIMLTSNVLTPFKSIESELGTEFDVKYSHKHVIQPDQAKFLACLKGIRRPLEFTWK